jgi:hypothetical protein
MRFLNPYYWFYRFAKWRVTVWSDRRNMQMAGDVAVVAEHNRLHPDDCQVYVPYLPLVIISTNGEKSYRYLAWEAWVNIKCQKNVAREESKQTKVKVLPGPALNKNRLIREQLFEKLSEARGQIPVTVSKIIGRPARWLDHKNYAGRFDGSEQALEVFNVNADEQLQVLQTLQSCRSALEKKAGAPLMFIFHTEERSKKLLNSK